MGGWCCGGAACPGSLGDTHQRLALVAPLWSLQLWLGGGGGNANFLYGMNLLWGGLQTVLLLQLLRAAAWQEAKREERAADGEGGAGAAEEPGSGAASDGDAKQA